MKPYERYKSSGVQWLGEVPEHWRMTKIKYIAELTPSKSEVIELDKECSFVPMEKLKLGNLVLDETRKISDVANSYTYFKDGDLLIAKVTPCFENKNFAIAENLINGIGFGSSEIYVLRPQNCDIRYLFYRLQENAFMELATGAMTGAGGLKRIPSDFLNNFVIATPPESEQSAIAAYLDERTAYLDRLIAKQQSLSEKLSEKRTALITEAVCGRLAIDGMANPALRDSGIQCLGKVPEHWEVERAKFNFNFSKGLTITKENLVDKGIPCVNYGEIHSKFGFEVNPDIHDLKSVPSEYLEHSQFALLKNGDFVFADTSEDVKGSGNFTHLNSDIPTFAGYHTIIARLFKQHNSKFLAYVFHSEPYRTQIRNQIKGVKVFSITQTMLKNTFIWLPPLSEQTTIADYLDKETTKIDRLQAKIAESVERLKEYRTTLITQVVTGKIKV